MARQRKPPAEPAAAQADPTASSSVEGAVSAPATVDGRREADPVSVTPDAVPVPGPDSAMQQLARANGADVGEGPVGSERVADPAVPAAATAEPVDPDQPDAELIHRALHWPSCPRDAARVERYASTRPARGDRPAEAVTVVRCQDCGASVVIDGLVATPHAPSAADQAAPMFTDGTPRPGRA